MIMVAIVLHLYYQDLWYEFKEKIEKLSSTDVDLYITVNKNSEYVDDMKTIAKDVFIVKNKGMDFGPFVYVWNEIKDKGYEYVLKLHGKKSEESNRKFGDNYGLYWRKALVNSLIGSKERFDSIVDFMSDNKEIYMAGSQLNFYDEHREPINHPNRLNCLESIEKLLNYVDSNEHGCFFAGSIFLVKCDYLKKFFKDCDLIKLYNEFEDYYSANGETLAHGIERVIGYGVPKHNGKFLGLDSVLL